MAIHRLDNDCHGAHPPDTKVCPRGSPYFWFLALTERRTLVKLNQGLLALGNRKIRRLPRRPA